MRLLSFLLVLGLSPLSVVVAFIPTATLYNRVSHSLLSSTQDGFGADNHCGGGGAWKLRNDFPQFLNQCAIQSFLTIAGSLRDPQTIRWIHNFSQPIIPSSSTSSSIRTSVRLTGTTEATTAITSDQNVKNPDGQSYSKLLTFHGLGVMNTTLFPTWDAYFCTLLERPVETFVVQSSGVQVQDYELEINPASLCTRIVSVREHIAAELAHDLSVVANSMGQHTIDSYWDYLDNQRDYEEEEEEEAADPFMGIGATSASSAAVDHHPVTMSSGADSNPRRLPPHNLVFLEYSLDALGDKAPSPLRKGNFDLVTLLATQESIHRILNHNNHHRKEGMMVSNDYAIYQHYLLNFLHGTVGKSLYRDSTLWKSR